MPKLLYINPYANKKDEEKCERMLRQLGFKPGQIFSHEELTDRIWLLYNALSRAERDELLGVKLAPKENEDMQEEWMIGVLDMLEFTNLLQKYLRFIPDEELRDLHEIHGKHRKKVRSRHDR
jgi:hypothetical protein